MYGRHNRLPLNLEFLISPPLMGDADCRCLISYSQPGRVEKSRITPTFTRLGRVNPPPQGGGESLVVEQDGPRRSTGGLTG